MTSSNNHGIVSIGRRFQLRMAAAFITLQVLLTGLFSFALYLFMDSGIQANQALAHADYRSLSQMLMPSVVILAVFGITLAIVFSSIFVVLLRHQIAGSIYRCRAVLEALAERRFESFRSIHPDDQLGEIAVSLDRAVKTVREDIQDVCIEVSRARSNLAAGQMSELTDRLDTLDLVLLRWDGVQQIP